MRVASKLCIILSSCLLLHTAGKAQDSARNQDSLILYLKQSLGLPDADIKLVVTDSLLLAKIKALVKLDTSKLKPTLPAINFSTNEVSTKPFLKVEGGYLSYNYIDQSADDSLFIGNNVSQHLVSIGVNATIAQVLPVRVTYFERQTNSVYFKDFRDVRIDVDIQRYRQLKLRKAIAGLKNNMELPELPDLKNSVNELSSSLNRYNNFVNDPQLISQLIRAKETMVRSDFPDTSSAYKDSVVRKAERFVQLFETLRSRRDQYQHKADSVQQLYLQAEKKAKDIQQLLERKSLSPNDIEKIAGMSAPNSKMVRQLRQAYGGLRSFSLGRTLPNFSPLTVQNVNVKGINFDYSKNRIYLALAAGLVDFRIRDFLYNKEKPVTQYLYSVRAGYGLKERDHLILTYFRGRKQLFGNSFSNQGSEIQGISIEGQVYVQKNIRVYGEVAQSGVPIQSIVGLENKATINIKDDSQRAWLAGFAAYFPASQTTVEGHYQHSGLNYQGFNSFQYNAAASSWAFRAEQSIWKRQITLQVAFRKNDFNNPQILQRYNSNTVYKNLMLSFRKVQWPSVSLGYIPSSQYTAVGNQVYENHYQTFIGNISHQYKVGTAKGGTLIAMSQFFNDRRDSSMIYFNAKNLLLSQSFTFSLFTATMSISQTYNSQYKLIVMEEGLSAIFLRKINAGFTVKINNLNTTITKVGFTARTGFSLGRLGEFNLLMDQNYLPSLGNTLYQYRMYNLAFTKYF